MDPARIDAAEMVNVGGANRKKCLRKYSPLVHLATAPECKRNKLFFFHDEKG
jgi:hypothetical protein